MNFWCKIGQHRSMSQPRFPYRVLNFGDLAKFSIDFCILYAESPPYFYFRFVWPTDLESIPHTSTPRATIFAKFEINMTIHCWVIAFLRKLPWPLTFWPWTVVVHGESHGQPVHQVRRPYAYPFLSCVITFPLVTIENAYAATAHAQYHMTRE